MSSLRRRVRKGLTNPMDAVKYAHRHSSIRVQRLNQHWHRRRYWQESGPIVPERDWDTLVVLDACRADVYSELADFTGEFDTVQSNGTNTIQWLRNNFPGPHHDVVYVSANPQVARLDDGLFHEVYPLFATEWDEDVEAVRPGDVTAATLEAHEEHPNKRVIAHYIQPHAPYLASDSVHSPFVQTPEIASLGIDTDRDSLRRAYRRNLELVLDAIEPLTRDVDGKVVVTSDHGELLGERMRPIPIRGYEHAASIRHRKLVDVPWHELPGGERREVTADPPVQSRRESEAAEVRDRLESLGYR